jgi:hypothetical protein
MNTAGAPGTSKLANAIPRPAAEVLKEYLEYQAKASRYDKSCRELLERKGAPEITYRWLVELSCGCITECLTDSPEYLPADARYSCTLGEEISAEAYRAGKRRPPYAKTSLMHWHDTRIEYPEGPQSAPCLGWPGYLWCADHDEARDLPYREISKWLKRRREHPQRYTDNNTPMPASAEWAVELSCGHHGTVFTELGWIPEYGSKEKNQEVEKARLDSAAAEGETERAAMFEELLRDTRYEPPIERRCNQCAYVRRIIGQRLVGPLPKPRAKRQPRPAPEPGKTLKLAEAKAARLRKELAQAEAEAARLREERTSS